MIKYSEPAEARQPTTRWRLYQFKGEDVLREYIVNVVISMSNVHKHNMHVHTLVRYMYILLYLG